MKLLSVMFIVCVMMSACLGFGIFAKVSADEVTATTFDFTMEDGASLKVCSFNEGVVSENALRFRTMLKKSDLPEGNGVKVVTIITLTEKLTANNLNSENEFTLENLDNKEIAYLPVVFSKANNNLTENQDGDYYVFNACVYDVKAENVTKNFSARSYITDANGAITQYTDYDATNNSRSMWDLANVSKDGADTSEEAYGPKANMTEKDYLSSLCQTFDVTINVENGTYIQTVKYGEKLSKYIGNADFRAGVAEYENFSYATAFNDAEGKESSNAIITKDTTLTAVYGDEGKVLIDGTVVTGVGSKFYDYTTEIVIPEALCIEEIGALAFCASEADGGFAGNKKLTKIVMSESVTTIGHRAFYECRELQTVIMPGVTEIVSNDTDYEHFKECVKLSVVVVGESFRVDTTTNTAQHQRVFYHDWGGTSANGITKVYLTSSNGTLTVTNHSNRNKLLDLTPYHLNETENDVCGTWRWVDGVPKYTSHENKDGVCSKCGKETTAGLSYAKYESKDEYYVSGYTGSDKVVYVRATYNDLPVTAIGKGAFLGNTNITKVVMPTSVKTIHGEAFQGCSALETVIMPGVTEISTFTAENSILGVAENHHFLYCNKLTTIVVGASFNVKAGEGTEKAGERVFYSEQEGYVAGSTIVYLTSPGGNLTIHSNSSRNGLLNATPRYFNNTEYDVCGMWKWVNGEPTLSKNTSHNYVGDVCANCGEEKHTAGLLFTKYGDTASYYVSAYNGSDTEVLVPSKYLGLPVTAIGIEAFYGNTNIIKIVMPESVKTIHGKAFYGCTGLQTVIMPGVTTITTIAASNSVFGKVEHSQFLDCNSLTVVVAGSSLSVLAGAGTSGGDQRVFFTSNSARYTKTKIYLTSTDGVINAHSASASGSARNNMIDLTPYHYSSTRPTDEAELTTTWDYYNGVPTLWKDIPVAE